MGKEGNQASAFSDFAINQFSDLRRLMFWHGSNFAVKIVYFSIFIIIKATVFGLASFFYNIVTGYSGTSIFIDILFATFVFTTFYGFYQWFEQIVSFRKHYKDESKLEFTMSSHYAHQRDYLLEKYIHIFVIMLVGGYYAGAVAVFVPYYAYTSSISGKETDVWMVGVCVYSSVVIYTHILFFTFIRDFNYLLCLIGLIVWSLMPIIYGVLHGL